MPRIEPPPEAEERLRQAAIVWIASVRPDGRPHLVPVWFAYLDGAIYLAVAPASVKARNLAESPRAVLALEDGVQPVIVEGRALVVDGSVPEAVRGAFGAKYEWDLQSERVYTLLLRFEPERWLAW